MLKNKKTATVITPCSWVNEGKGLRVWGIKRVWGYGYRAFFS